MSNRTLLEFNHDYAPAMYSNEGGEPIEEWARKISLYLRSGNPEHLPTGVTFVRMRHHSEPFMDYVRDPFARKDQSHDRS